LKELKERTFPITSNYYLKLALRSFLARPFVSLFDAWVAMKLLFLDEYQVRLGKFFGYFNLLAISLDPFSKQCCRSHYL
jgi:hypothetical protein